MAIVVETAGEEDATKGGARGVIFGFTLSRRLSVFVGRKYGNRMDLLPSAAAGLFGR